MILDAEELHRLTGRRRRKGQREALDYMGIPYRVRPDGRLVVIAADLEHRERAQAAVPAPDWSALSSLRRQYP